MKRKRLNNFADSIIGILTGYQIVLNYQAFKNHGEGKYILDLMSGKFTFNENEEEKFVIFKNLLNWFNNEIENNNIGKKYLTEARVVFQVSNEKMVERRFELKRWFFFKKVFIFKNPEFKTKIQVYIKTDEKDYSKEKEWVIWT